jgi:hypothetical protein
MLISLNLEVEFRWQQKQTFALTFAMLIQAIWFGKPIANPSLWNQASGFSADNKKPVLIRASSVLEVRLSRSLNSPVGTGRRKSSGSAVSMPGCAGEGD